MAVIIKNVQLRRNILIAVAATVVVSVIITKIPAFFKKSGNNKDDSADRFQVFTGNPERFYSFPANQDELKAKTSEELGLKENFLSEEATADEIKGDETGKNNGEASEIKTINISSGDDLGKIIEGVSGGAEIRLAPGSYSFNVELSKPLSISGAGEKTIIKADNENDPILKINNAEVRIQNLVFKDSKQGVVGENAMIKAEHIKFLNLETVAFYIRNGEADLDNVYIYNSGSAVKSVDSKGSIRNSIIKNNHKAGVQLLGSAFEIIGNEITENQSYGVFADARSEAKLEGNNIQDNEGHEVRLESKKEVFR